MTDISPETNWKPRSYFAGALAGLFMGLLAAYFYARASEEHHQQGPERIKTMDALKLGVSLMSLIRQITDLGVGNGKK
jgi:hypothetical protein